MSTRAAISMLMLLTPVVFAVGCVRRTISITSTPPGALVWVNDEEVGRTPLEIDFVYYGTYDVRLNRDGYEPLLTVGEAKPPLWDSLGVDFFAEIAPADLESKIAWHYDLEPVNNDPQGLLQRAESLRSMTTAGD